MKILIADDSRVMRQIIGRTLRLAGFSGHDLLEAADGRQAYDLVRSQAPDLVLSDWHMPAMTGLQVLRALRDGAVAVPFGFVTIESTPEMHTAAEDAGALFVITKPFGVDDFRRTLSPLLR